MSEDLFAEMTETLFEDKSILSEEYRPDVIVERDDEIDAYRSALKTFSSAEIPQTYLFTGKRVLEKRPLQST